MKIFKINSNSDFLALCEQIKTHKMGAKIMSLKKQIHFFLIKDIKNPAINILKQDALSIGAELVSHKNSILGSLGYSTALLMATKAQIKKLIEKEKNQDFELKGLAKFLKKDFTKPKKPKLMAIININNDSFNPKSRVKEIDFEKYLEKLLILKPHYIDIGAVSSRPGSMYCGAKEEFDRLKNILDLIYKKNLYKNTIFSLDSFDEKCIKYALDHGFGFINDITGLKNTNLAKLAKEYNATYCLMHMQNNPLNMQDNPHYDDILFELDKFFTKKLEILESFGVKDVVLDVGIGFGKSAEHNMILIKHLEHFLHHKKELLIGASRKSMINKYFKSEVENRLAGSLYLHFQAFKNGASIIRTHDIYEHQQIFALDQAYDNIIG